MKILWLKAELLHPVDKGGKIRTYQMLRHLKRAHEVTYLTLTRPTDPPEAFELAAEYCHELIGVPMRETRKFSSRFYWDLALNLASPLPYVLQRYRSAAMRRAIERAVRQSAYDVIVCDFLHPSINLTAGLGVPTVLFQHNVEYMIWRRHYENAAGAVKRAYFRSQWQRMYRYEAAACRGFNAVVAVSDVDRDLMRREFGLTEVYDVPTGVDTEYFRPNGERRDPFGLVFTGSMDWMPNEDAIIYFAENILPRVAESIPGVTLTVVGRNPTSRVMALAESDRRIEVTGRVDDIRPYVDRSSCYVVPIRIGGGTRLKIYEAMAMGKPVVSTNVGAEGLPVRHGQEVLLADDPREFARAVVRVLSDEAAAGAIGQRARAFVREGLGWDRVADEFAQVCGRVAGGRARLRAA